jgi:replicative DNA helicase
MIFSYELETQLLAGLLKYPEKYLEISAFISEKDFWNEGSKINRTLFKVLKQAVENGETIDDIVLTQRVKSLGISFEDNIEPLDYIQSLSLRKIAKDTVSSTAKELKKFTMRREIHSCCSDIGKKMRSLPSSTDYAGIIETADEIYNGQINLYETGVDRPVNIYDKMEDLIEERGNNPIDQFGYEGPHPKLQGMYGSLLRPGNITVVVARSGVGKTQFCLDFTTKACARYNLPLLHFDNGEMSEEELINRQCAALSGVPLHLIESGNWRKAGEPIVEKIRSVWSKVQKQKLFYYNVGGMNVDAQINLLKRFYYAEVGRGNPLVFNFDYIKTTYENSSNNKSEYQVVGELVDKYKKCIQREIVSDTGPCISMFTSVQSNRTGIVNNRQSANIVDDESIVSLSDRITQFSSHMFILRNKTSDELQNEKGFGTHKFINVKARHLGKDVFSAINPVKMSDGSLKKNFVNLDFNNFAITEKGDLRDIVDGLSTTASVSNDSEDDVPNLS